MIEYTTISYSISDIMCHLKKNYSSFLESNARWINKNNGTEFMRTISGNSFVER